MKKVPAVVNRLSKKLNEERRELIHWKDIEERYAKYGTEDHINTALIQARGNIPNCQDRIEQYEYALKVIDVPSVPSVIAVLEWKLLELRDERDAYEAAKNEPDFGQFFSKEKQDQTLKEIAEFEHVLNMIK